jgi:hypothetical protein
MKNIEVPDLEKLKSRGAIKMKRKLVIGIVAIATFALSAGIAAAKVNFSGAWTLDTSKSEGLPPGMTQTMTITQNGDRIDVERRVKAGAGEERIVKDLFVLDAKETDFTPTIIGGGGATIKKAKRTSKWAGNGNGFDTTEEVTLNAPDGGEDTIKAAQRWSLSADGKILTVEMDIQTPSGALKTKRVFVKQ